MRDGNDHSLKHVAGGRTWQAGECFGFGFRRGSSHSGFDIFCDGCTGDRRPGWGGGAVAGKHDATAALQEHHAAVADGGLLAGDGWGDGGLVCGRYVTRWVWIGARLPCCSSFIVALAAKTTPTHAAKTVAASALWAAAARHNRPDTVAHDCHASSAVRCCVICVYDDACNDKHTWICFATSSKRALRGGVIMGRMQLVQGTTASTNRAQARARTGVTQDLCGGDCDLVYAVDQVPP